MKNQLGIFTHQRSPLDVGSGRTSSPSAIAVDVHVALPKSGPRPTLRPNVVKGPPKPGTELLEMERGRRKGSGGTQRPDVSRAKGSKRGGALVELKTACPRMPRCRGPGGVGGAWRGSASTGTPSERRFLASGWRLHSIFALSLTKCDLRALLRKTEKKFFLNKS